MVVPSTRGLGHSCGCARSSARARSSAYAHSSPCARGCGVAVAMGTYVFTCATTDEKVRVEYTFGYRRNGDGKPRIFLHHSSVPYAAPQP